MSVMSSKNIEVGTAILIKDRKPTLNEANSEGKVMYNTESMGLWISYWNHIPEDAFQWYMLPDPDPVDSLKTYTASHKANFERLFNKEFIDPIIQNALIKPLLWRFYQHGAGLK